MSKPREFAHLIKNKFGSADNINQLSASEYLLPCTRIHSFVVVVALLHLLVSSRPETLD